MSKTKPNEAVLEAYEAGQRHFGENYVRRRARIPHGPLADAAGGQVQEMVDKARSLPDDIQWHYIGHLQTNKAKMVAQSACARQPRLRCAQPCAAPRWRQSPTSSSSRPWTAPSWRASSTGPANPSVRGASGGRGSGAVTRRAVPAGRERLGVFVQVNVSGEASKSGVEPDECESLVRHVLSECPKLRLHGLMTIGKTGDTTAKYFAVLAGLRDQLHAAGIPGLPTPLELSMGMSADFESAIEAGSTSVRLGSTIFGARDYSNRARG